jgi:hypothetical protein
MRAPCCEELQQHGLAAIVGEPNRLAGRRLQGERRRARADREQVRVRRRLGRRRRQALDLAGARLDVGVEADGVGRADERRRCVAFRRRGRRRRRRLVRRPRQQQKADDERADEGQKGARKQDRPFGNGARRRRLCLEPLTLQPCRLAHALSCSRGLGRQRP